MTWSIPISYETHPDIIDSILSGIDYHSLLNLRLVDQDWRYAVDFFLSGKSLTIDKFSTKKVLARNRRYLPLPVFHFRGDPIAQAMLMRRVNRLVIGAPVPAQMNKAMRDLSRDCFVMLIHQHGGDQRVTLAVDRLVITIPRWCDCASRHPRSLIHDAREVLLLVGEASPGQSAWDGGDYDDQRGCRLVLDAVTPSVKLLRLLLSNGHSLDEIGFPAGGHCRWGDDLKVELVLTQSAGHRHDFPPDLCERWATRLGIGNGQVSAVRRPAAALLT
ncbi:hypothetical protein A1Q2_00437 [Trichosporon asahii var. asahii CBS 8904]|uniref:F-box domain-containing protein n=1 Tax=Trichosporon asahii var. asahii (strain CBS 8904) TaxID=1220162 RepID=K1W083_TRIAC|nr:hypothetical protein A1Q2_00437 [Trichosporon asahii var. asahii CBS 8904]